MGPANDIPDDDIPGVTPSGATEHTEPGPRREVGPESETRGGSEAPADTLGDNDRPMIED